MATSASSSYQVGATTSADGSAAASGSQQDNANAGGNKRLQQTQAQVDEVVDIMRTNVDKVLERDQKLSELDDRAAQLEVVSRQFETVATRVKRKYFWQNMKMWIILGCVVAVVIIIIVVAVVIKTNGG